MIHNLGLMKLFASKIESFYLYAELLVAYYKTSITASQ